MTGFGRHLPDIMQPMAGIAKRTKHHPVINVGLGREAVTALSPTKLPLRVGNGHTSRPHSYYFALLLSPNNFSIKKVVVKHKHFLLENLLTLI